MTRRQLFQLSGIGFTGTSRCAVGSTGTLSQVKEMAEREVLVIIGWRESRIPNAQKGFDVTGADAGALAMTAWRYSSSVSPDGNWVAWIPLSSDFDVYHDEPIVLFTNDPRAVHSVRFQGRSGLFVAISSNARHLALIAVVGEALDRRLMVLNPATANLECDVTGLVTRFSLNDVYRFQISADGGRLLVGSRELFVVIDVPSRKVMVEGEGQYASLSPRGDALAFLDKREDLVVTTLATGANRVIRNPWWIVAGVGGWSPDSRFLLAGARALLGFFYHLVVIDLATAEFADLWRLGEGDVGETSFFIKRRLLSPID